jgi:hypothetical protein
LRGVGGSHLRAGGDGEDALGQARGDGVVRQRVGELVQRVGDGGDGAERVDGRVDGGGHAHADAAFFLLVRDDDRVRSQRLAHQSDRLAHRRGGEGLEPHL